MIGRTLESRPGPLVGPVLFALLAAALDALAFATGDFNPAVGSLLPWAAAAVFFLGRERRRAFRFTDDALETDHPPASIPFADLEGLRAPRRPADPLRAGPAAYPIQLIHSGGVFRIPARLTVPSDEVFAFLYQQLSTSGSRAVHPALDDFLRRKERQFGPGRVWSYRARTHLGGGDEYRIVRALSLALLVAGLAWLGWGVSRQGSPWAPAGGVATFFGALFGFVFWTASRGPYDVQQIKNWRQSSLVLAPDGLALVQGDLDGQLHWHEINDVRLAGRAFTPWGGQPVGPGIRLDVTGAVIVIADLYDRPLAHILERIRSFRRGKPSGERFGTENDSHGKGIRRPDAD